MWALNPVPCVFMREREERLGYTEKKAMWGHRQRLGLCFHKPRTPGASKVGRGKGDSPIELFEGGPCWHQMVTLLTWIFWVCQLSPTWYNVSCSQLMSQIDSYQLQLVCPTMEHHPVRHLQHETLQTTFDTFGQSQHLLHTLHDVFLCFSCNFTFIEIIMHNMQKILHIFFHLQC